MIVQTDRLIEYKKFKRRCKDESEKLAVEYAEMYANSIETIILSERKPKEVIFRESGRIFGLVDKAFSDKKRVYTFNLAVSLLSVYWLYGKHLHKWVISK